MEEQEIDQHILNYLQGNATANEIETLRNWIKGDKANEVAFETMSTYWHKSTLKVQYHDLDAAYAKLKSLSFDDSKAEMKHIPQGNHASNFGWLRYAAVLLLFSSIAGLIYFLISPTENPVKIEVVKSIVKENPRGQKLTTFLPDGSKVILNSESRVEYQPGFDGAERLIMLDGEAFFEVKKDETKPFRVLSNGVSVVALGTSFNVNSKYSNLTEVSLVSGTVQVSGENNHSVVLTPGKSAVVKEVGDIIVNNFDIDEKVGWKDGFLVFKENSLVEIFQKLTDWYGVEIILEVPMGQSQHFSGKYRNTPLDEVLEGIAFVHHFDFEITGDTVKIFKKK